MTDAYIYDAVRTPRGKGNPKGALHAVAPVLVGVWFDVTGAYHWAFVAIIVLFFAAASLIAASKAPAE